MREFVKRPESLAALALAGVLIPAVTIGATDHKKKAAPPTTAVDANAMRQIRNAIDAGEGDDGLRNLRQKLAAEPSSVDARLTLAAAYEWRGASELAIDHYRIAADQFDSERKTMGVTGHAVYQAADNPNDVTAWHDFPTADAARSFASNPRLKEVMSRAGVSGVPDIWVVNEAK